MRRIVFVLLALPALSACGAVAAEKQWMKIDQSYTTLDYRRDLKACTSGGGWFREGTLDEACMKARGWVDVAVQEVKPPEPTPYRSGVPSAPKGR
ncbi:MAG: hypothetical protein HY294_10590 [Candidatus Rokubacteria bacterium]|nr:hypothetical protein [Candidatus Rokubacteria bacterium]MBI3826431.1 hypothetical protein [Candidatus Rokubacteria bacterium]